MDSTQRAQRTAHETGLASDRPAYPRPARLGLFVAAACALLALVLGARRLAQLQQDELELATQPETLRAARALPTATRLSARLAELRLTRDQRAQFELCANGALDAAAFRGAFELLILHAEAQQLMLRVPLDAAHLRHVRSQAGQSCLLLGSGLIEHTGTYRVEAVWPAGPVPPAVLDVGLWVHVQATARLAPSDLCGVLGLGCAILLGLLLALRGFPAAGAPLAPEPPRPGITRVLSPLCSLAVLYGAMQWPSAGGLATLYKGCALLGLQLGLAWFLLARSAPTRSARASALGLTRSTRPLLATALVLAAVPALVGAARLALRVVPSTGVAPIESFIARPSGMLSAALLGAILPLGEELFFRGYLLGAFLRYGRLFAAGVSVVAFALMHVEQSWGNWGALLAIVLTGSVLCALRLLTGSSALSAISHVAYNLTLSASSLAAALPA